MTKNTEIIFKRKLNENEKTYFHLRYYHKVKARRVIDQIECGYYGEDVCYRYLPFHDEDLFNAFMGELIEEGIFEYDK